MHYYCRLCKFTTKLKYDYERHLNTNKHKRNKKEDIRQKIIKKNKLLRENTCSHCKKQFTRSFNLKRHIETVHMNGRNVVEEEIIEEIEQEKKTGLNYIRVRCPICHKSFSNKYHCKRHIKGKHEDVDIDDKDIKEDNEMDYKLPKPRIKCRYCNMVFKQKHGLTKHLKNCVEKNDVYKKENEKLKRENNKLRKELELLKQANLEE